MWAILFSIFSVSLFFQILNKSVSQFQNDEAEIEDLLEPNGIENPLEPNGIENPLEPNGIENPLEPNGIENPLEPNGIENPLEPNGIENPLEPNGIENPLEPNGIENPLEPNGIENPLEPNGIENPLEPNGIENPLEPNGIENPLEPNGIENPLEPNGIENPLEQVIGGVEMSNEDDNRIVQTTTSEDIKKIPTNDLCSKNSSIIMDVEAAISIANGESKGTHRIHENKTVEEIISLINEYQRQIQIYQNILKTKK